MVGLSDGRCCVECCPRSGEYGPLLLVQRDHSTYARGEKMTMIPECLQHSLSGVALLICLSGSWPSEVAWKAWDTSVCAILATANTACQQF